mmetsp:Transcript_3075/g.4197  ORF Transcript_3075/g.4197 Transcript_3075/m.4197 type:complete len:226 (-) Transcript_3075:720-1397(-)
MLLLDCLLLELQLQLLLLELLILLDSQLLCFEFQPLLVKFHLLGTLNFLQALHFLSFGFFNFTSFLSFQFFTNAFFILLDSLAFFFDLGFFVLHSLLFKLNLLQMSLAFFFFKLFAFVFNSLPLLLQLGLPLGVLFILLEQLLLLYNTLFFFQKLELLELDAFVVDSSPFFFQPESLVFHSLSLFSEVGFIFQLLLQFPSFTVQQKLFFFCKSLVILNDANKPVD